MAKTKEGKSKYQAFCEQQKEREREQERARNYNRWNLMHNFLSEVRKMCNLPVIQRENPYRVKGK